MAYTTSYRAGRPRPGMQHAVTVEFTPGGKGYDYFVPSRSVAPRIGSTVIVNTGDCGAARAKPVNVRYVRAVNPHDQLKTLFEVPTELARREESSSPRHPSSADEISDNQEECAMPNIVIENQTLVNGRQVESYSNAELYRLISDAEKEIELLESIKHKPARLTKEIDSKRSALKGLISMLDELDSKAA